MEVPGLDRTGVQRSHGFGSSEGGSQVLRILQGCVGLAASALITATLVAAAPQQSGSSQSSSRPEDPGAGVFNRLCSDCHDAERIVSRRRTSTDWEDVIQKMIEKGA